MSLEIFQKFIIFPSKRLEIAMEFMENKCNGCFVINEMLSWQVDCEHLECHEYLFKTLFLLKNGGEKRLPKVLVQPYEYTPERWLECFQVFKKISSLDKNIFELDFEYMMNAMEYSLREGETSSILTFYKSMENTIDSTQNKSYRSFFVIDDRGFYKPNLTMDDKSRKIKIFRFSDYDLIIFRRALANYGERHNVSELKLLYSVSDFLPMNNGEEFSIKPVVEDGLKFYNINDIEKHIAYSSGFDDKLSGRCDRDILAVI
jgi:hypothetical protein